MRTEGFRDFHSRITAIHVNYYQTLFLSEQFLIGNAGLMRRSPNALVGSTFSKNRYSARFNYRLGTIAARIDDFRSARLLSDFLLTVSVFEWYLDWLYRLGESCKRSGFSQRRSDNFYETLEAIIRNSAHPISPIEKDTLDYFRLRRNSLVHDSGIPSHLLQVLRNSKGAAMNAYWRNTSATLNTLDFQSGDLSKFTEREMRDVFEIVNHMARNIDTGLLSALSIDEILNYVLVEFIPKHKEIILTKSREIYFRKFAREAYRRFMVNEADAMSFIRAVPLYKLT